jgi:glycosyltransferase involved in cell wall biosynthesis
VSGIEAMTRRRAGLRQIRLSVVVTTYNNPRGLELVLTGLARQTFQDFELLIADDGSGPDTAGLVAGYAARAPFPVRHLWQPDQGFRKCTICNKAIVEAEGDYLVFFDGDCIPARNCLEIHLRAARKDSYLAGGAVYLDRWLSQRLTPADISSGRLDRPGLWWAHVNKRRRLLVRHLPLVREMMNRRVPREPSWRGGNSSAFAEHMRAVGGFDERFTYGFEDADFGHRLQALGIHGRSIRYSNPVMHVEHSRPYADPVQLARNRELYDENRTVRLTWTPYGLPSG